MRFNLQSVTRGRNLEQIGWNAGYVLVQFRGRPAQYVFGPAIPREHVEKILRVPFPDRQFELTIKKKFQCKKIGDAG
jgi:hypothetical protein